MRIGINAHKLSFEAGYRQAGTSRYIEALLGELPAIAPDDVILAFTGRVPESWIERFPAAIDWRQARFPTGWPPARILWEQTAGTGLGRRTGLDVMHCPLNVAPLFPGAPTVVTVHDIAYERFPEHYPTGQRHYLSAMTRISARRASHVIAVSQATASDLAKFYGVSPELMTVVPNGIESSFQPQSDNDRAAFRAQQELPDEFILFVGTLQPRKNLDGLLRAYSLIAERLSWPLVVIGGAGWLDSPIYGLVRRLGIGSRVRFTGYVNPEELPRWYAAATIFTFPSHYEGFGLPVAEAMASGTPVITSKTSALPEVAGNSAVLVDPSAPREIARAMLELATDSERRKELSSLGLAQARQFTWRKAAEATYAVYQRVGSQAQRKKYRS
jgi:glycosyltransferase involved in cell wall biosynthesis